MCLGRFGEDEVAGLAFRQMPGDALAIAAPQPAVEIRCERLEIGTLVGGMGQCF
jgi:hypothetical protein